MNAKELRLKAAMKTFAWQSFTTAVRSAAVFVLLCLCFGVQVYSAQKNACGAAAECRTQGNRNKDDFGDELPDGATCRIGTDRLSFSSQPLNLAVSPDGTALAAVSRDRTFTIWEVPSGREVYCSKEQRWLPEPLLFLNRDHVLVSGDNCVCMIDIRTGCVCRLFEGLASCAAVNGGGTAATILRKTSDPSIIRLEHWELRRSNTVVSKSLQIDRGFKSAEIGVDLCVSADTSTLLSLVSDRSSSETPPRQVLRIIDARTGKESSCHDLVPGDACALAISDDGRWAAVGSASSLIRILDTRTGKERIRWHAAGRRAVRCWPFYCAFSPDGTRLLCTTPDGIALWSCATGSQIKLFEGTTGPARFVATSNLVAFVQDFAIRLVDSHTGKDCIPYPRPTGAIAFAPHQGILAFAQKGSVSIVDRFKGRPLADLTPALEQIDALTFSEDGSFLVASNGDAVEIWNVATRKRIARVGQDRVDYVGFTDGSNDLIAIIDGKLVTWNRFAGLRATRFNDGKLVAVSRDGKIAALVEPSKALRLVEVETGNVRAVIPAYRPTINFRRWWRSSLGGIPAIVADEVLWRPRFSSDGTLFMAGVNARSNPLVTGIRVWDTALGTPLPWLMRDDEWCLPWAQLAPSKDFLAAVDVSGRVRVVNARTGEALRTLGSAMSGPRWTGDFAADGRIVATPGRGVVTIWEVASGEVCGQLSVLGGKTRRIVISRDCRAMGVLGSGYTICIYDLLRLSGSEAHPECQNWSMSEIRRAMTQLRGPDAKRAQRVVEQLVAIGDAATPMLAERLKSRPKLGQQDPAELIRQLDDEQYENRLRAESYLWRARSTVFPKLKSMVGTIQSSEARRRIEQLLAKERSMTYTTEEIETIRLVRTLEFIGSPTAIRLLTVFARDADDALLKDEAKTSAAKLLRSAKSREGRE